jgi:orotidine-5'-phosphate decarboxylase
MNEKLIVALDVPDIESAKSIVYKLGEQINFYKIGLELMMSGEYFSLIKFLKNHNKKVFADLKLYDISNTIASAVKNLSKYEIDLLTIHSASYEIMKQACDNKGKMNIVAVTVLTNLDSKDLVQMGFDKDLSIEKLVENKTKMILDCGLDGVVASALEAKNLRNKFGEDFIIVTPGIRLNINQNDDQKRVSDVKSAVRNGASYLVVGRPIIQSNNPKESAQQFIKLIHEA